MILASNSQRRQEILKDAGFNFRVITSNIEEISDKENVIERILDIAEKKLEQIAKYVYVVTALDRMSNESHGKKKKVKL